MKKKKRGKTRKAAKAVRRSSKNSRKKQSNSLPIILVIIILILLILGVRASITGRQTAPLAPIGEFFTVWKDGNISEGSAKVLVLILLATLLLTITTAARIPPYFGIPLSLVASFLLTAYVKGEALIGIFWSYDALPLTVATFLPLLALFGFTYVAMLRRSVVLMTMQWIVWIIYFFYSLSKPVLYFILSSYGYNIGGIDWPSDVVAIPAYGTTQFLYFLIASGINIIIAIVMTFANGRILKRAYKHLKEMEEVTVEQNVADVQRGMEEQRRVGEQARGGSPIHP